MKHQLYSHMMVIFYNNDGELLEWDLRDHTMIYEWCLSNPDELSTDKKCNAYLNCLDNELCKECKTFYKTIVNYYRSNKK
jgi:hypothetical protein